MKLPPGMTTTQCQGCGMRIAFVVTNEGKTVPLDMGVCYVLKTDPETGKEFWERDGINETERTAFVSHFATCGAVKMFEKNKKDKP